VCAGAVVNQHILNEARSLLEPVRERPEGPEEPVYAEVDQEDPDAIQVVQEEPVAGSEAYPEAGSGEGLAAAAQVELLVPPPKPPRLGWVRRGPKRYDLRSSPEEKITPDAASTEV
jgi:hypothetical protein